MYVLLLLCCDRFCLMLWVECFPVRDCVLYVPSWRWYFLFVWCCLLVYVCMLWLVYCCLCIDVIGLFCVRLSAIVLYLFVFGVRVSIVVCCVAVCWSIGLSCVHCLVLLFCFRVCLVC